MGTPSQDRDDDGGRDWSGRRGGRPGAGQGPSRGDGHGWSERHGWDGSGWGGKWNGPWQQAGWSEPEEPRDRIQRRSTGGKQVRIGDAERDQAVSQLSEHFVAGRITQAEFEERSEAATRARYAGELVALFDDLPQEQPQRLPVRRGPHRPPPFMMLMPFLMVGLVISSIALAAPWMLWGLFWMVMISGAARRRWGYYRR